MLEKELGMRCQAEVIQGSHRQGSKPRSWVNWEFQSDTRNRCEVGALVVSGKLATIVSERHRFHRSWDLESHPHLEHGKTRHCVEFQYIFCLGIQCYCWSGSFGKERKGEEEMVFEFLSNSTMLWYHREHGLETLQKPHKGKLNIPLGRSLWKILLTGTAGQWCWIIVCAQSMKMLWRSKISHRNTNFISCTHYQCESILSKQITIFPCKFTCHGSLLVSLSLISKYFHALFYE